MFTNVDTQRFGTNANAHIHKVANHLENDNCANNSKGNGYDERNQLRNEQVTTIEQSICTIRIYSNRSK